MKFSAREDIDTRIDEVFAAVTDFERFERQIQGRGARITQRTAGPPGPGTIWEVSFTFRGRARQLTAEVADMDRPNLLVIDLRSDGLSGEFRVELLPLSQAKTRMSASIDLAASTLSSRLLLQSLKLAKANLTNRFKKRVAAFAQSVEQGARR
ncbi:SRPBCC family protein [Salipiger sp. IMCC34102]|uniref:SRPBCC family protein n=1 Tax=Salipiger sp. IMCC34102 TaxID=2510647 RepID=UPI00101D8BCE|nr:SRPBCC family protein [Salipiger sp. IMCC34102]RYH02193.1 SRPBCC family protein [Salipiger sp. IMCC34102]